MTSGVPGPECRHVDSGISTAETDVTTAVDDKGGKLGTVYADVVVDNSGTPGELRERVRVLRSDNFPLPAGSSGFCPRKRIVCLRISWAVTAEG